MTQRQRERALGWAAVCCLLLSLGILLLQAGIVVYAERTAAAAYIARNHHGLTPAQLAAGRDAAAWSVVTDMPAWDVAMVALFIAGLAFLWAWRGRRRFRVFAETWHESLQEQRSEISGYADKLRERWPSTSA